MERPFSDDLDLRQAVYQLSHQAIDGLVVVQSRRTGRKHLVLPPSMPVVVSDSILVDRYLSASADQTGGGAPAAGTLSPLSWSCGAAPSHHSRREQWGDGSNEEFADFPV